MTQRQKDLVFIASGGRTGTNFFGDAIGQVVSNCHSEHEPEVLLTRDPFNWRPVRNVGFWNVYLGRLLGMTGTRVLGTRLKLGRISFETASKRLRDARLRWHSRIEQDLIVESSPPLWLVSEHLEEIWPGAKLIAIVRDPRTWVRSFTNHTGRHDPRDRVTWVPPGRLTPNKLGQTEFIGPWRNWGTFEKLAWEWRVINETLVRAVDRHPDARLWRFEDLFNGTSQHANELVEFVCDFEGRPYPHASIETLLKKRVNASSGVAQDWSNWTPDQARHLQHHCGQLMKVFDYGQEPDWQKLLQKRV